MKKIEELASRCPFAENAKSKIITGVSKKEMKKHIKEWNDEFEVIVMIPNKTWFGFYNWCIKSMLWMSKKDLIAVPDSQNNFILLQRLSHLVEASDDLMKNTDYYEKLGQNDLNMVHYRKSLTGAE